jgi:hypothetical protein
MVFFSIAATADDHWRRGKRLKEQSQNTITKRLEQLIIWRFLTCALVIIWSSLLSSSSSYRRPIRLAREVVDVLLWLGFVLELSWRLFRRTVAFQRLLDKIRTIQKRIQRQLKKSGCQLGVWTKGLITVLRAIRKQFHPTREPIFKKRSTCKAILGGGWHGSNDDAICSVGRNWKMDRILTWLHYHPWSPMGQQQDAVAKEVELCDATGPALAPSRSSMERLEANYYHEEDQPFISMTSKKKG